MSVRKIYSFGFNTTIAAHGAQNFNGIIPSNNRQFNILSIMLDWKCRVNTTQQLIPWSGNTTQDIMFSIWHTGYNYPISQPITPMAPINPTNNGDAIIFYSPGKRNYQNFYTENDITFAFTQANQDLLNAVDLWISIITEIEELT